MERIVALIAFLLGAAFIWLAEKSWRWFVGRHPATPLDRHIARRNGAAYLLTLVVFLFTAWVFCFGTYGRLDGGRDWWSVQALDIMTLPEVVGSIAAFLAGMLIVRKRVALKARYNEFISVLRSPAPQPAAPAHDNGGGGFPWLAGTAGLAAVAFVAAVVAFIFYPDLGNRVSSIKVAGLEAQFATSTAHSARVAIQPDRVRTDNRYVMNGWADVGTTLTTFTDPALNKVLAKSDPLVRYESLAHQIRIDNFLRAFAVPISEVMRCFSQDFDPRYTFVQSRAAPLAKKWKRFAVEVATESETGPTDTFDSIGGDLKDLVVLVDADLGARHSRCGDPIDEAYFQSMKYGEVIASLDQHRSEIFVDGYVISFISDMLMSTAGAEEALRYLNEVRDHLDQSVGAIAGEYNYYFARAQAKWQSEYWMLEDWIEDVRQARLIANRIANAVKEGNGGADAKWDMVESHYRMLAAKSMNSLVYGYVRDWLQGRRRAALELEEAKAFAKQLSDWLEEQSEAELLNAHDSESVNYLLLMANSYDTLAMYELMASQSGLDMSAGHCERSLGALSASKRIFDGLFQAFKISDIEEIHRISTASFSAHLNIYESVCAPLTAQ
jgi:hypothetical protein